MAVKGDKMRSRRKAETPSFVPPKVSGPDPREFPVGSVQSRAAARQIVVAYLKQERAEIETEFGKDAPQILFVMEELNALARQYVLRLVRHARMVARVYGQDFAFPTIEECRRNRARLGKSP